MGFKTLGFSGQRMQYPLNSMFGMVVGEQNTGKSYLFQSNPDAFIFNLDLSSTVIPTCAATIWPGVNAEGRPIDVNGALIKLQWEDVLEKKKQLIQMASADQPRPKCVVFDTITPMSRMLKPWVAKQMGKAQFSQLHGPAAYDKLFEEILQIAFDLRQAGYGVWFIAHLSKEFVQISEDSSTKQTELILNLSQGMNRRLTPAVEMIAPICCDVVTEMVPRTKTIKLSNGTTKEQTVHDTLTAYKRKIAFSDPRFAGLIRTRTVNRMSDIPLDGKSPWSAFETAFNDANKES
jgi:hypothetical protein